MKNKKLIYECKTHKLLTEQWNLLTEVQRNDIKLFEREIAPLYQKLHEALSANLTEPDIEKLFKRAEKISAGERTGIGKAVDFAKLPIKITSEINKKMDDLFKEKIKAMQPVKNFDAAFNKAKENIVNKTGGKDGKLMKAVEAYRDFAKKHPVVQSLIIAALVTLAGFSFGPMGGAIANFGLRSIDRLLKGEDISDVLYKGVKSAAVGALVGFGARKLVEFVKGMSVELDPPVKVQDVSLQSATVQFSSNNPEIQAALEKAGLLNNAEVVDICTHDPSLAQKFADQIEQLKQLSSAENLSPENIQEITKKITELKAISEESMQGWKVIFEKSKDYLLDPEKNALLAQKGITSKISYERFKELMASDTTDTFSKTADILQKHGIDNMWSKFDVNTTNFIPTEKFASETASVLKKLVTTLGTGQDVSTSTELITKSNPLAVSEFLSRAVKVQGGVDVTELTNSILNAKKLANVFDTVGSAVQAAAQGAVAGADTARDNKKDAKVDAALDDLKESMLLRDILINEGIFDKAKGAFKTAKDAVSGAVSTAGEKIGTAAKNITQKITYDKLITAWKKAGKPLELSKVLDIMKQAGMKDADIEAVQKDEEPQSNPQDRTEKIKLAAEFIKKNKLSAAVISYIKSAESSKDTSPSPEAK